MTIQASHSNQINTLKCTHYTVGLPDHVTSPESNVILVTKIMPKCVTQVDYRVKKRKRCTTK